jgi:hypothetical protein
MTKLKVSKADGDLIIATTKVLIKYANAIEEYMQNAPKDDGVNLTFEEPTTELLDAITYLDTQAHERGSHIVGQIKEDLEATDQLQDEAYRRQQERFKRAEALQREARVAAGKKAAETKRQRKLATPE